MNKVRYYFILGVLLLGVFLLIFVSVYFLRNGRQIAARQLTKIFKRPVALESVGYVFPRTIILNGLEVEGLLWVEQARIKPALSNFWRKVIVLSDVTLKQPFLILHRLKEGKIVFWEQPEQLNLSEPSADASSPAKPSASTATGPNFLKALNVIVKRLHVQNGNLFFPDHYSANPVELAVSNIQLDAKNVPLTLFSMKTEFAMFGTIVAGHLPFLGDQIGARGWLNWEKRDMDARITIEDSKSKLSFWSDINARDNDCLVKGNIRLNDQASARQEPRPQIETPDDLVMGILETTGMGVDLDFDFQTRLDSWQLSQSDIHFKGNLTQLTEVTEDERTRVMNDWKNVGKQLGVLGEQKTEAVGK